MAGDGRIVIDVVLDDGSVAKGVADIGGKIKGLGDSGEKASLGIGKIVTALGLVGLASKGIDMIKQSLDGAISRYDTLNAFPRVMQQMGFDAEESKAAIDKLSSGIDGLPTSLDDIASKTQRIAVMTGDLDGAVETTLALNNAFIASGASTADAERGLDQYVQMLAKGEVDLQSWRTLQETMPVALNETAKAFGFTGKSAQNDLYKALKDGKITFDEFNDQIIDLSNKTGGFADIARESSGGIKTSWTNMKTAIVRGVANVIGAIDEAMGGVGSIEGVIEKFKDGINKAFKAIVAAIPEVVEKIKSIYSAIEPWLPLFGAVVAGVGAMILAWSTFNSVKGIIDNVKTSFKALNTVISANPWVLVVGAIIAAAILVYTYWDPISEFFIKLWESIKEAGLAIWDALKEKWDFAVSGLKASWADVTQFFSSLWEGIKGIFSAVYSWIDSATGGAFSAYVTIIKGYMDTISNNIKAIWEYVKGTFRNVLDFLKALVKGDFEGMKNAIQSQMENAKTLIQTIWDNIKQFLSTTLQTILGFVKEKFESVKTTIQQKLEAAKAALIEKFQAMLTNATQKAASIVSTVRAKFEEAKTAITTKLAEAKTALVNKFTEMVSSALAKGAEIVSTVRTKFGEVKSAIREKLVEAVKEVGTQIGKMPGKVIEKVGEMKTAGRDLIRGLIGGIKDMAKDAIDAVTGVVSSVIDQAKSLLKIKSPSRVFREIGAFTGEGLALGIKGSEKDNEKASASLTGTLINELKEMQQSAKESIGVFGEIVVQELEKVKQKWNSVVQKMIEESEARFKLMYGVGVSAGRGLYDGLASMEGALVAKATAIANAIKEAMASALDIHSPSRWMRDMIGKNMMVGWSIGMDHEKAATIRKAQEAAGWMQPDLPEVLGFTNKLRGVAIPNVNVTPFSAALGGAGNQSVSTDNRKSYSPTFNNHFTKEESSPAEVARKNKQQSQKQAMEWGLI